MEKGVVLSDLLHLLKRAGLNEYESKAYAALLGLGSASASEISRRAAVPRARVYDVLVSLEKKGFLAQELSKPTRFRVFHPETALGNLELAKKNNFAAELEQLSGLKKELSVHADSMKAGQQPSIGETAFFVSGNASIEAKIKELLEKSEKEAVVFAQEKDSFEKAALLKRALKDSSGKIKVKLFSKNALAMQNDFAGLANIALFGAEAACSLMVFDEKTALFFLENEKNESQKALVVESPGLAAFLKQSVK